MAPVSDFALVRRWLIGWAFWRTREKYVGRQPSFASELTMPSNISATGVGEGTVDARFDDANRSRCYAGIQFTDPGQDSFDAVGPPATSDTSDEDATDSAGGDITSLADYEGGVVMARSPVPGTCHRPVFINRIGVLNPTYSP